MLELRLDWREEGAGQWDMGGFLGGGYSECKGSEVGIKTREVNREQGGGGGHWARKVTPEKLEELKGCFPGKTLWAIARGVAFIPG